MRTVRFDKFAGSKFERTKCGPKGGGQEARSNPLAPTNIFNQLRHFLEAVWVKIGQTQPSFSLYPFDFSIVESVIGHFHTRVSDLVLDEFVRVSLFDQ